MQLPTIDMEKDKAKELAAQYRAAVKERRDAEDEMMARAYREVAKGTPLIRLSEAIALGGTVEKIARDWSGTEYPVTLPAVAVARADGKFAWTNGIAQDGSLTILGKEQVSVMNRKQRIRLPAGTFEGIETKPGRAGAWSGIETGEFNALIPPVPPPLRPSHHLRNYHLLWEADWSRRIGPPPGDPALLKHVGGDLYAVLAVWDLTELEQAVLAGRPIEA
jgi:hypothetical protein